MKTRLLCLLYFASILFPTLINAAILTGPLTNPVNGHTYYLLDTATWTDSESEALTMNGHLVTINNQAENDWVLNTFLPLVPTTLSSSVIWIGLNDAAQEGTFVWSSGEPVAFTNWSPGSPDNYHWGSHGYENYAHMLLNSVYLGQWNDYTNDANTASASYGVVEVVPLPFAIWLFGSGLLLLFGISRNKN
jgi:hypothetical protein